MVKLKLFKISQNVNNEYDTFSDAVVIAETKEDAKRIHPSNTGCLKGIFYDEEKKEFWNTYSKSSETYKFEDDYGSWTNDLDKIEVIELGLLYTTTNFKEGDVICASFHAG